MSRLHFTLLGIMEAGLHRKASRQSSPHLHSLHPLRPPPNNKVRKSHFVNFQPRFQSPWQFENSSILSLNTFCSEVPVLKYCPAQGIYVLKEESKREEGFRKCRCNLKLAIIISYSSCVRLITSHTMYFLYLEISEFFSKPRFTIPILQMK